MRSDSILDSEITLFVIGAGLVLAMILFSRRASAGHAQVVGFPRAGDTGLFL